MSSEDVTESQSIAIRRLARARLQHRLLTAIVGFFFALVAGVAFMAAIYAPPRPVETSLFAIPLVTTLLVAVMALARRRIVFFVLNRMSSSSSLALVHLGQVSSYVVPICGFVLWLIGFRTRYAPLASLSMGFSLMYFSVALIFNEALGVRVEIRDPLPVVSTRLRRDTFLVSVGTRDEVWYCRGCDFLIETSRTPRKDGESSDDFQASRESVEEG
jgi:hypothetical protein